MIFWHTYTSSLFFTRACLVMLGIFLGVFTAFAEPKVVMPSLTKMPRSTELWLTTCKVLVSPAQSHVVSATQDGYLEVLVKDQTKLKKDQVWAVMQPERLRIAEQMLELDLKQMEERLRDLELDYDDKTLALEETLDKSTAELSQMQELAKSPEVKGQKELKDKVQEALQRLTNEVKRGEDRLARQKKDSVLEAEQKKVRLDIRSRKNEFEDLKKRSQLWAPFDCRLNLHLQSALKTESFPHKVWLHGGELLADLSDDQHYEVELPAISTELASVAKSTLTLTIDPQKPDASIKAHFDRVSTNTKNVNLAQSFIFRVDENDADKAKARVGTQVIAQVYTQLPKPLPIVTKAQVMKHFPENGGAMSWQQMVRHIWPGAKVVAIGHRALALEPAGDQP